MFALLTVTKGKDFVLISFLGCVRVVINDQVTVTIQM